MVLLRLLHYNNNKNNKTINLLRKYAKSFINLQNSQLSTIQSGEQQHFSELAVPIHDFDKNIDNGSLLEPCETDLSDIQPKLRPTFNLAAYADKSETLQQLLKLGVNIHRLEKRKNVPELILGLDFEQDIKKYLLFLHDHGVPSEEFGNFLTRNPFILQENIDYLHGRVDYLKQKKFSPIMISKVITKNPYWLNFSTERIDRRLGHFQSTFDLLGKEVRKLAIIQPRLITYHMESIRLNTFSLEQEMGFRKPDLKTLLVTRPKLWMINGKNLLKRFNYIHNIMKIPHEMIVRQPQALFCRESRLRERHQFLQTINRAQYDSTLPNFVSLIELTSGTDQEFAVNVAKSTPTTFNAFLKTL